MAVEIEMVRACDPSTEAPPLVVPRRADADAIGHGRILPLVGGVRPHVYDVVFDGSRQRVYADTPAGAVTALIDGYADLWDKYRTTRSEVDDVELRGESATPELSIRQQDAYFEMLVARTAFANTTRCTLQSVENERAQACGDWDQLTDEERTQCTESANGPSPVGVLVDMPWDGGEGEPATIEMGVWETPHCKLVINRGDYGLFDPDGTPEPMSTVGDEDANGAVIVGPYPENMIVIDPTSDWSLLDSLERANLIEVTVRPVDLPDSYYTDAVELGDRILAGEESETATPAAAPDDWAGTSDEEDDFEEPVSDPTKHV